VAYLLYLGARSLLASQETSTEADSRQQSRSAGRRERIGLARQELIVAAANPKALLLFTAFVPQFVDPSRPAVPQLLILGALYIAIEFLAACAWATAGSRIGSAGLSPRVRRRLERATGGVFIALAGGLAIADKK